MHVMDRARVAYGRPHPRRVAPGVRRDDEVVAGARVEGGRHRGDGTETVSGHGEVGGAVARAPAAGSVRLTAG